MTLLNFSVPFHFKYRLVTVYYCYNFSVTCRVCQCFSSLYTQTECIQIVMDYFDVSESNCLQLVASNNLVNFNQ